MESDNAGWFERVFGPDDAKGAKFGCVGIVLVFVSGVGLLPSLCSTKPSTPIAEATPTPEAAAQPVAYTADQLSMICRAGIAAEFGRHPLTMMTKPIDTGLVRVEYRRPDDNSLWKNDCRIEGNRIVWRTVDTMPGSGPGRWRTTENDDVLTFKLEGRSVTTESSDGSSASETYKF